MKPIVTLTLNPCIDGAAQAAAVRPTRKIRTRQCRGRIWRFHFAA